VSVHASVVVYRHGHSESRPQPCDTELNQPWKPPRVSVAPLGPADLHVPGFRALEQLGDWHAECVADSHKRADRYVGRPLLDPSVVRCVHAELFGGLILREIVRPPNLPDAEPKLPKNHIFFDSHGRKPWPLGAGQ
jgi:hypothetical protein